MKKLILSFLVFASLSTQAAEIRFGNIPYQGKVLKQKSDGRLTYGLVYLQEEGAGEDEERVPSCYIGTKSEICSLLQIGVKEMNQAENYTGSNAYKLIECKSNSSNAIETDFRTERESGKLIRSFRIGLIRGC